MRKSKAPISTVRLIRNARDLRKHFGLPTPSVDVMEKAVRAAARRCGREARRRFKGPRAFWKKQEHVLSCTADRLRHLTPPPVIPLTPTISLAEFGVKDPELSAALDIICDLFAARGKNGVRLDQPDPGSWHDPKAAIAACRFLQKHGLAQFVEERGVWEFCGRAK